jgi:hypothetical protein
VGSTFLGRIGGPLRMEAWRWNLNAHEKWSPFRYPARVEFLIKTLNVVVDSFACRHSSCYSTHFVQWWEKYRGSICQSNPVYMGCVGEVVTSPHRHLAKIFSNLVDIF